MYLRSADGTNSSLMVSLAATCRSYSGSPDSSTLRKKSLCVLLSTNKRTEPSSPYSNPSERIHFAGWSSVICTKPAPYALVSPFIHIIAGRKQSLPHSEQSDGNVETMGRSSSLGWVERIVSLCPVAEGVLATKVTLSSSGMIIRKVSSSSSDNADIEKRKTHKASRTECFCIGNFRQGARSSNPSTRVRVRCLGFFDP